jgi:hypothetical protein
VLLIPRELLTDAFKSSSGPATRQTRSGPVLLEPVDADDELNRPGARNTYALAPGELNYGKDKKGDYAAYRMQVTPSFTPQTDNAPWLRMARSKFVHILHSASSHHHHAQRNSPNSPTIGDRHRRWSRLRRVGCRHRAKTSGYRLLGFGKGK